MGIIGGTGLGASLSKFGGQAIDVPTPFGAPSDRILLTRWEGVEVAFLSRHGPGHRFNPSTVPYRANIWALKKLGVRWVIASGATGSLREDIEPGHLVICDQVVDRTYRREPTFFDEPGVVAHVELADPFCPALRARLIDAAAQVSTTVHHAATYVCMEGPQFSTRAESLLYRQWGGDVIGMTCMPEARLAREAQLCYATVALPTDYDCWRPHDSSRPQRELLDEITANLAAATDNAIALIRAVLPRLAGASACRCGAALALAIWSDRNQIAPTLRSRLGLLIDGRQADE